MGSSEVERGKRRPCTPCHPPTSPGDLPTSSSDVDSPRQLQQDQHPQHLLAASADAPQLSMGRRPRSLSVGPTDFDSPNSACFLSPACKAALDLRVGPTIVSPSQGPTKLRKALDTKNGQLVAVKSATKGATEGHPASLSQTAWQRLEQEEGALELLRGCAQVVQLLSSICNESDVDICARSLVLEYVPGGSAADAIAEFGGALPEAVVRRYARGMLQGLAVVHSRGLLHNELRASHVLVSSSGQAKLCGFGSSVRANEGATRVKQRAHGGTQWMAPEVLRQEDRTTASDIWSIGCTVLEMLRGACPWGPDMSDVLGCIGYGTELPKFPGQLSEDCSDFLYTCLDWDPLRRPSAEELLWHPFLCSSSPPNRGLRVLLPCADDMKSPNSGSQPQSKPRDFPPCRDPQSPSGMASSSSSSEGRPSRGHRSPRGLPPHRQPGFQGPQSCSPGRLSPHGLSAQGCPGLPSPPTGLALRSPRSFSIPRVHSPQSSCSSQGLSPHPGLSPQSVPGPKAQPPRSHSSLHGASPQRSPRPQGMMPWGTPCPEAPSRRGKLTKVMPGPAPQLSRRTLPSAANVGGNGQMCAAAEVFLPKAHTSPRREERDARQHSLRLSATESSLHKATVTRPRAAPSSASQSQPAWAPFAGLDARDGTGGAAANHNPPSPTPMAGPAWISFKGPFEEGDEDALDAEPIERAPTFSQAVHHQPPRKEGRAHSENGGPVGEAGAGSVHGHGGAPVELSPSRSKRGTLCSQVGMHARVCEGRAYVEKEGPGRESSIDEGGSRLVLRQQRRDSSEEVPVLDAGPTFIRRASCGVPDHNCPGPTSVDHAECMLRPLLRRHSQAQAGAEQGGECSPTSVHAATHSPRLGRINQLLREISKEYNDAAGMLSQGAMGELVMESDSGALRRRALTMAAPKGHGPRRSFDVLPSVSLQTPHKRTPSASGVGSALGCQLPMGSKVPSPSTSQQRAICNGWDSPNRRNALAKSMSCSVQAAEAEVLPVPSFTRVKSVLRGDTSTHERD